jgi:hypothetical protein
MFGVSRRPTGIPETKRSEWRLGAGPTSGDDGFVRETFTLPRDEARVRARAILDHWPAAANMTAVETWRELPGGEIEFTMRRLRSAD